MYTTYIAHVTVGRDIDISLGDTRIHIIYPESLLGFLELLTQPIINTNCDAKIFVLALCKFNTRNNYLDFTNTIDANLVS